MALTCVTDGCEGRRAIGEIRCDDENPTKWSPYCAECFQLMADDYPSRLLGLDDQPQWVGPAVDAIMTYWLHGFASDEAVNDEETHAALLAWWASKDALAGALEILHVVEQALNETGFMIADVRD